MSEANNISNKQAKLAELLAWFESDDFDLVLAEDRLAQASKIANDIETELGALENRITILKQKFDQDEA